MLQYMSLQTDTETLNTGHIFVTYQKLLGGNKIKRGVPWKYLSLKGKRTL